MPSKFDKVSLVISLLIFLPVASFFIWLDVESGMWKSDLVAISACIGFIALAVAAYQIGRWLPGRYSTGHRFNLCFLGGMCALFIDALIVFLVAFTMGYQPWLIYVIVPIFFIGVASLTAASALAGMMKERS